MLIQLPIPVLPPRRRRHRKHSVPFATLSTSRSYPHHAKEDTCPQAFHGLNCINPASTVSLGLPKHVHSVLTSYGLGSSAQHAGDLMRTTKKTKIASTDSNVSTMKNTPTLGKCCASFIGRKSGLAATMLCPGHERFVKVNGRLQGWKIC